jgi:hypothetical protein
MAALYEETGRADQARRLRERADTIRAIER